MKGEKPVKSFFDKFKNKRENKPTLSLINEEGEEVFDAKSMLKITEEFYKKLFSQREVSQSVINFFLNYISPVSSSSGYMQKLLAPFTFQELLDAIISFINGRSPGPDGISVEFYKRVYEIIKYDLLRMFNLFLAGARIPAKFKAGLIARIPKDGPSNLVENARPITMLNTDYKIYTKMISTRLDPILKEIIHDSQ